MAAGLNRNVDTILDGFHFYIDMTPSWRLPFLICSLSPEFNQGASIPLRPSPGVVFALPFQRVRLIPIPLCDPPEPITVSLEGRKSGHILGVALELAKVGYAGGTGHLDTELGDCSRALASEQALSLSQIRPVRGLG